MKQTLLNLGDAKPKRIWRMTMVDAGPNPHKGPPHIARYQCKRCGQDQDWTPADTLTEIRLGIPCPNCNR